MPDIRYSYAHAPTLRDFARSHAFIRGVMGPFGSGKSSGSIMEFPRLGHLQPPGPDGIRRSRYGVIRNTYRQLRETTLESVMHWLPERHFGTYNAGHHRYNITGFKNVEIELLFCALDRPDQVSNLLSLELTGAFVNEAREVPWAIIKPLTGRVGRWRPYGMRPYLPGIWCDTNPPDPESWWYQLFEDPTPEMLELARIWSDKYFAVTGIRRSFAEVFKQPSGLSPEAENLPYLEPGYYDLLAVDPDQDWVKVHVHGEYGFVKTGKPVYPTYRDNLHCRPFELIPGRLIRRSWDFGLTPACTFAQTTPTGQLRFRFELCTDRAGIDDFAEEVRAFCNEHLPGYTFRDIGDPAGDAGKDVMTTCFDIIEAKLGQRPDYGPVDLTSRLEPVRYGLNTLIDGEPALIVHPDCKRVRRGFQGGYEYARMQTSQVKYSDKPNKNIYSHPHDTVQYTAADHFGEVLTEGRMVNGHALPGQVHFPNEQGPTHRASRNPLRDPEPEFQQYSSDDYNPLNF